MVPLAQAEEAARRTRELLDAQGWCLWRCSTLKNEVICVTMDNGDERAPWGYPVYTQTELELLSSAGASTLRLVHEAKKRAGAIVIEVRRRRVGGGEMCPPDAFPRGEVTPGGSWDETNSVLWKDTIEIITAS